MAKSLLFMLVVVPTAIFAMSLKEAKRAILSEDFQMLNVDVDLEGNTVFKPWSFSNDDIEFTNINEQKPIIKWDYSTESETNTLNGDIRTDYIDLKRNLSWSKASALAGVDAIVELVIVCDKEFSDMFNRDNRRILDYLTVYFWDINTRYKSLPDDNISFRVNGIIVIFSTAGQPFIEEARASDGRAEFNRILSRYAKWVYQQQNSMPKFDLAPLITNARQEWGGGLAHMSAACWVDNNEQRHLGTAVWNDNGAWGSVTVAAHELGHNLGAPHDDEPNFPGGCNERGFIMAGANDDYRYFFSSCSNRVISSFVRSDSASCLRSIQGSPVIDPSFSSPKAPTMAEQCKRLLNTDAAYIEKQDTYNCKSMRCLKPGDNGVIWIWSLAPVENTQCGDGGRCFRGRCRAPAHIFRNVASGLCMRASNPFEYMAPAEMFSCPKDGTPLERLLVGQEGIGTTLASPFTYNGNHENGERCFFTGDGEGNAIWTDRCNKDNGWHGWDFVDSGNSRFLLKHRATGRCAKPSNRNIGSAVQTYAQCNTNDNDMLWTRGL